LKRTDYCGRIDRRYLGQPVSVMGWVHRRRDHGGVIFIDLRDREGIVQVVCDPDRAETFAIAEKLRNEYCIAVSGRVRPRPEGTVNANLVSGEVEVLAATIEILNASATPPFLPDDENLSETVRLTHRVLDLRRPQMQNNLMLRYRAAMSARRYLDAEGFIASVRTAGGQRRFSREVLRRIAFIRVAQTIGLTLDEVREALATLPQGRTPTKADWARLSRAWRPRLDAQIALLARLRDQLTSCIGCGCLSLQACALYNPDDRARSRGQSLCRQCSDARPSVVSQLRRSHETSPA